MQSIRFLLVLAFLLLLQPLLVFGQINSPGARTLFVRNFLYRSNWRVMERSSPSSDVDGGPQRSPDSRVIAWEHTFVYGLPRQVMWVGVVPVVNGPPASLGGAGGQPSETGLADPKLFVQYDGFYSKNRPGGFSRLAGFFGVKLPWGQQGFSTGATDLLQGLILTHATTSWFVNTDFQWTATTTNNESKAGNLLQLDASVMYRLHKYPERNDLFVVLEVNSFIEGRSTRDGMEVLGTGGESVFISPGVEIFLRRNLIMELSVQLPVYQKLNGHQLSKDWVFVAGFRYIH